MVNDRSDEQLLRDFGEGRVEACFAELVRRHLDLVYSAALRIVADPHLAEDASQGVFAALARDATRICEQLASGMPLSAWLHATARNQAAKIVRSEERRRRREKEAASMNELTRDETAALWDHVAPQLDEALGSLADDDRHVLLLRFFEKKTAREIGAQCGVSEEAAQKRVSRAVERLRGRLAGDGQPASAVALASAMAAWSVQAAPTGLAAAILNQVVASAALASASVGLAAAVSRPISYLVMTKLQTAIVAGVIVAAAVPLGMRQVDIMRRRQAASLMRADLQSVDSTPGLTPEAGDRFVNEIARLSKRRDQLKAELAKPSGEHGPKRPERAQGPVLLERGRTTNLKDLVYAGNDSPTAVLQSHLTAERDGDLEAFVALTLVSPGSMERQQRELSSPDARQEIQQEMRDGFAEVKSVELLDELADTDFRRRLRYRTISDNGMSTNTVTTGLTANGWMQIEH